MMHSGHGEKCRKQFIFNHLTYTYYSLQALMEAGYPSLKKLPRSLKILLENLLRQTAIKRLPEEALISLAAYKPGKPLTDVSFYPARILMQDFTGVPAIVDLAALREALMEQGRDPSLIDPFIPVDLVIDHSVTVDAYGNQEAFEVNKKFEMQRNYERYAFLKWGQETFENLRVVPPGTGICHQVNLEYLGHVVYKTPLNNGTILVFPDSVLGTDSHTTMINGLSILGWGVGGIEAEAAMLGQPYTMKIPEVVGFKLKGALQSGVTATDLVLTITEMLRKHGVVSKFVEFYGPGLNHLPLADRATIANMAPEYGATCGFFPIDEETLKYMALSGRDKDHIALVKCYAELQGLWREQEEEDLEFNETLELDLGDVEPSLAGPKRPQDRLLLKETASFFKNHHPEIKEVALLEKDYTLKTGDIVIAAITSCTNTSNPSVMIAAGLLAKKALEKGLHVKPWVKTSLAPGSQVVSAYLNNSGLQAALNTLGFNIVGYGCTTCIGNSGPLDPAIEAAIESIDLTVAAVLSGNRNFESRIHPAVKDNYLASPPLVVAYALAGTMCLDLLTEPLGEDPLGEPVFLRDIWPSAEEIQATLKQFITPALFQEKYQDVFKGPKEWQEIKPPSSLNYHWDLKSTYIRTPPFCAKDHLPPTKICEARPLVILGDSITTDHISPAGAIKEDSPAGLYLLEQGIKPEDFNSYGSRRGNHEVMVRGTFSNKRLANEMVPDVKGGFTQYMPDKIHMSIYDASKLYQEQGVPLVIIAGKEYGTGSSRDWAAKGTLLLGVKAIIAESFERIHRSNLIGMGVLPLLFPIGVTRQTLNLTGEETFTLLNLDTLAPMQQLTLTITYPQEHKVNIPVEVAIYTKEELEYYLKGGILPYVISKIVKE